MTYDEILNDNDIKKVLFRPSFNPSFNDDGSIATGFTIVKKEGLTEEMLKSYTYAGMHSSVGGMIVFEK